MKSIDDSSAKPALRCIVAALLLAVNLILFGCVTPALWKEAEGMPASVHSIKVRSITSAFKSSDGTVVRVCMEVVNAAHRSERAVTLNIPVQDKRKWQIQRNPDSKTGGAALTYVEYAPNISALTPGCSTYGTRLPILHSTFAEPAKTAQSSPANPAPDQGKRIPEAIYVISRDGLPVNVGYLSEIPIFEGSYSIDVPLHHISDQAGSDAKPYLYLLTPVTVVLDAAVVVLYVMALGHTNVHYQFNSPSQSPTLIIKGTAR